MSSMFMRSARGATTAAAVVVGLVVCGSVPCAQAATGPSVAHPTSGYVQAGAAVSPNVTGLKTTGGMHALSTSLPSAVSLARYTVPVGDQKQVGSCVTWAIGYSMLGWYSMRSGSSTTYAPMYLYSQDHQPDDGGSSSEDAYAILTTQGIAPHARYSHSDWDYTDKPTASDRAAAAANTTTAPHYLFNLYGSDTAGFAGRQAIETAIAAQHPVALGIPIFKSFYTLDRAHSTMRASAVTPGSQSDGGHVVLVVGYDSKGVRIQNQWGTSWGDEGYATLDWAFVQKYADEASWISGFSKDLPATAPAQVDSFSADVSSFGTSSAWVSASWRGTGEYDDSVRHPVTGFTTTLTGSDGSTQTATEAPSSSWTSFRIGYSTTYTLSVVARNSIGSGPVRTITFTPSDYGANGDHKTGVLAAATLPSPAMPPAGAPPATNPATPVAKYPVFGFDGVELRWSAPTYTGNRVLKRYQVSIVGKLRGRTTYRHTFSVSSSARALKLPYASTAHRSARFVTTGASTYRITLRVQNAAGKWSSPSATLTKARWLGGISTWTQAV